MRSNWIVLVVVAFALAGCSQGDKAETASTADNAYSTESIAEVAEVVNLNLTGMTCGGCADRIQTALAKAPGVADCEVDLEAKTATIKVADAGAASTDALIALVTEMGYGAEVKQ